MAKKNVKETKTQTKRQAKQNKTKSEEEKCQKVFIWRLEAYEVRGFIFCFVYEYSHLSKVRKTKKSNSHYSNRGVYILSADKIWGGVTKIEIPSDDSFGMTHGAN